MKPFAFATGLCLLAVGAGASAWRGATSFAETHPTPHAGRPLHQVDSTRPEALRPRPHVLVLGTVGPGSSSARLPGVDLATGITQITGVAISPLLGVSCIGAWHYFRTPPAQRSQLPWFCHPLAWGCGLVILGLCLLKDVLGTAAPPLLKKPLDIAELIENKLSAVVASAAFVPLVANQMTRAVSGAVESTQWMISSQGAAASILPFELGWMGLDLSWLVIPLSILGFFLVWLASHTINVLIILCPFGFIDALLKLARLTLLGMLLLAYVINPYWGLLLSLLILLGAVVIAGWTFRLMLFGMLMSGDLVWRGRGRRRAAPERPHVFLARASGGVPVRTYGRLTVAPDGTLQFTYRPWLVLPRRVVSLPSGSLILAKGLLFHTLMAGSDASGLFRSLVMFMPRYRGRERDLAVHLGIATVREGVFHRGFQSVRAWLGEVLNWNRPGEEQGRTVGKQMPGL